MYFSIMGNELCNRRCCVDVPNRTRSVDGRRHDETGCLLVPGETGQWCPRGLVLNLGLLETFTREYQQMTST